MPKKEAILRCLPAGAIGLFGLVVLMNAWVTEDAYITFRTVDNFVNGFGLTWNPSERVQSYTHPLWMFLNAGVYFCTREIFYTSIGVSVFVTLGAVLLLVFGFARSSVLAMAGVVACIFSRAFVDFSTSGLENPLTHLLLGAFFVVFMRADKFDLRILATLAFVASMGALNRMDTVLFYLPALVYGLWQHRHWRGLIAVAAGFVPFLMWGCFSLVYYGFPFPNTAYAKLNTGIDSGLLMAQGTYYYWDSLLRDPVTLPVILVGLVVAFTSREKRLYVLAGGIVFYLLYVVRIGGDFMSGRFFTAPFFGAVLLLVSTRFGSFRMVTSGVACIVLLGVMGPHPTVWVNSDYGKSQADLDFALHRGIADERAHYFQAASLRMADENEGELTHSLAIEGREIRAHGLPVFVSGNIGYQGFYAGAGVHIIDWHALSDPLLARLPVGNTHDWRIGHFKRQIPVGYVETLKLGKNRIQDPDLAQYYNRLKIVVHGPVFSLERFKTIWNLNSGHYAHLLLSQKRFSEYLSQSSVLFRAGLMQDALEWVDRAVVIDSTRSDGWFARFEILERVGDLDGARVAISKAIAHDGGNYDYRVAHLKLVDQYLNQGHFESAKGVLNEAVTFEPPFMEMFLEVGNLYAGEDHYDNALIVYQKALNDPDMQTVHHYRLPFTTGAKRYRYNLQIIAHYLIADVFYAQGRLTEAKAAYEQVLADKYDVPLDYHGTFVGLESCYMLSKIYLAQLNVAAAQKAIHQAVEGQVSNKRYWIQYCEVANMMFASGDLNNAIKVYRRVTEILFDDASVYVNLGNLYSHNGQLEDAAHMFKEAIRMSPDMWQAHLGLAHALVRSNKKSEAEKAYRQVLVLKEENKEARSGLAFVTE